MDEVAQLKPGWDGNYGWLTIAEADVIFPAGATWDQLGFELLDEVTAVDGTIFVLLRRDEERLR